jgi:hypothetical protein
MNNLEEDQKNSRVDETKSTGTAQEPETSIEEQVRQEFEYSADRGQPLEEQVENELSEPDYILPSPTRSLNDTKFKNITPDQKGRAFGVANQRNEPLDIVEKIEKRDKDRWELNPASAQSDDEE